MVPVTVSWPLIAVNVVARGVVHHRVAGRVRRQRALQEVQQTDEGSRDHDRADGNLLQFEQRKATLDSLLGYCDGHATSIGPESRADAIMYSDTQSRVDLLIIESSHRIPTAKVAGKFIRKTV